MKNKKILITGGTGFVGTNLVKYLRRNGYENLYVENSKSYNLLDKKRTEEMFEHIVPDIVIHLAALCGGIGVNSRNPGRFFYENMMMGLNVIEACRKYNVHKLVDLSTICAYPCITPIPFSEKDLWAGLPEYTNMPYAIAKKALGVMIDGYHRQYGLNATVIMPTNLFGPHDSLDLSKNHVIPALIRKVVDAKENQESIIVCYGDGSPTRDFLYVDDVCRAIELSINTDTPPDPMNIGGGLEISIKNLVESIIELVGYEGSVHWDTSKPNGQPRRCLDSSKAKEILGWVPKFDFKEGLKKTIEWYKEERKNKEEENGNS